METGCLTWATTFCVWFGWPDYFLWYVVNSCVWFGWPDYFVRCVVKRCVWFGWPGYFVYDCWVCRGQEGATKALVSVREYRTNLSAAVPDAAATRRRTLDTGLTVQRTGRRATNFRVCKAYPGMASQLENGILNRWRVTLILLHVRQYTQVKGNSCSRYLLTHRWMNLRALAEERKQARNKRLGGGTVS